MTEKTSPASLLFLPNANIRKLKKKLIDPKNGLHGYIELQERIKQEFHKAAHYHIVLNYARRNFGSGVKVTRKSHVKNNNAVISLKKTS